MKTQDQLQLIELMGEISERCACAQWLDGTEDVLWDAVNYGPKDWVFGRITQDDCEKLRELANKTQSWVIYNPSEDSEDEFDCFDLIDLNEWVLMKEYR